MTSVRRGTGSDVAGSRPYRPGDDAHAIDWAASARLSSAHSTDEFIVREYLAEEAPRVVVLSDRRPAMSLFPRPLPWLDKPEAMRQAAGLVAEATLAARGFFGYLDLGGDEEEGVPPRTHYELPKGALEGSFAAPEDNLARAFRFLAETQPILPAGTFVFVLSDFLMPFDEQAWIAAIERRWDIVPVVIQDPVWEQTFPYVDNIAFPFADPRTGRVTHIRMSAEEANARREHNEHRLRALFKHLRMLGVEPILVSSADPQQILLAFSGWTEQRIAQRGAGW